MLGRSALVALASLVMIAGCSAGDSETSPEEGSESDLFAGTPNKDIGQLFMVDQFGLDTTRAANVPALIKSKNLGAVILWNPAPKANGEGVRELVKSWAQTAKAAGVPELFVATDQEEAGTQRFKSDQGFTNLVDGATLGRSVAANGDAKICELHARITAREM